MTAIDQMNHPNLAVVHFNPYAGGKFWINCLSHHARAIPGLRVATPWHTEDLWLLDDLSHEEIQRRKIVCINSALPPAGQMNQWRYFELGCTYFWGDVLPKILEGNHTIPNPPMQLLNQYQCFIANHRTDTIGIKTTFDRFPNANHMLLTNAANFQQISRAKKQPSKRSWNLNWNDDIDIDDMFIVDVDNTYLDVERTIDCVKDCLEYLGLSTELDPNIHSFVTRYFDLHR